MVLAACYALLLPFSLYPRGDLDWLLRTLTAWLVFVIMREESGPRIRVAFSWIFAVSMAGTAVIGLLEFTGSLARDPRIVASLNLVGLGNRLFSTFQYPNTTAIMLLMGMVIAVGVAAERSNEPSLVVLLPLANLMSIAFFFALSRGAVLILPLSLILFFVGLPTPRRWPALLSFAVALSPALVALRGVGANSQIHNYISAWRWIGASVMAAALGSLVLAFFLRLPRWLQYGTVAALILAVGLSSGVILSRSGRPVLNASQTSSGIRVDSWVSRLLPSQATRLLDFNLQTASARLRLIWDQDALRIFKDHPLGSGGWGWDRSYRRYQSFNYTARETHDHYAQTAVEAGICGLAGLLIALGAILVSGWKARHQSFSWPMTAAVAALVSHSLIDFDLSFGVVWFVLWGMAGLAGSNPTIPSSTDATSPAMGWTGNLRSLGQRLNRGTGAVILFGMALVLTALSGTLGLAAHYGTVGAALNGQEQHFQATRALRVATILDPLNSDLALSFGDALQGAGQITEGIQSYERAVQLDPYYPLNQYKLSQALERVRRYDEAVSAAHLAVADQPMKGDYHIELGRVLSYDLIQELEGDQTEKALATAREMVQLGHDLEYSRTRAAPLQSIRMGDPPSWTPLLRLAYGQGLFLLGDFTEAQKALTDARKDKALAIEAEVWLYALYERTQNQGAMRALENKPWIRFRMMNPVYLRLLSMSSEPQ